MKKKIVWFIVSLILVLVLIGMYIRYHSQGSTTFQDLTQYHCSSIYNENNLKKILKNLEFNNYFIDTKKDTVEDKEVLTIFFDCSKEDEILEYYRNYHKMSLVEKDAVTLFALINNLDKLKLNYNVSNMKFAKEHHLPIIEDKFDATEYTYTRDMIEKLYNQDVRNYIDNPDSYMKYNIDLAVNEIAIYYREVNDIEKIHKIHIKEQKEIETIVNYIKSQNFKAPDGGYNGICNIWVDLNNGFIIGVFGEGYNDYGSIIKGNGEEIFADEKLSGLNDSNIVNKLLPEGLSEYIEQLILKNKI